MSGSHYLPGRNRQGVPTKPTASRAADGWAPVRILAGVITSVDPDKWTCTVGTEIGGRSYNDVDFSSSYLHPAGGEGSFVIPEPGAAVWLAKSSEGDYPPFILCYRGLPSRDVTERLNSRKPSLHSNRIPMRAGDVKVITRDGNGYAARRGGLTEVFASAAVKTLMSADLRLIRTLTTNMDFWSPGLSVELRSGNTDETPSGKSPTSYKLALNDYAEDERPIAELIMGVQPKALAEGEADGVSGIAGKPPASSATVRRPVLDFKVRRSGEESSPVTGRLLLDREGVAEIATKVSFLLQGGPGVRLFAQQSGDLSIDASRDVDVISERNLLLRAATQVTTKAGNLSMINNGSSVSIGVVPKDVIVDNSLFADLAAAMGEISAAAKAVGLPTINIDRLIGSLGQRKYAATKLRSE